MTPHRLKQLVSEYLVNAFASRSDIVCERTLVEMLRTRRTLDWRIYSTETRSYERYLLEYSSGEPASISFQFAVSLLPFPQIPAGPFGWFGNFLDLYEEEYNKYVWSMSWIELPNNEDKATEALRFCFCDGMIKHVFPVLQRMADELPTRSLGKRLTENAGGILDPSEPFQPIDCSEVKELAEKCGFSEIEKRWLLVGCEG